MNSFQYESNDPVDATQADQTQAENPYASTNEFELSEISSSGEELSPIAFATTLFVWTVVCSLSAAPSFLFAVQDLAKDQVVAMIIGVVIFIGIYTSADLLTRERPFRKDARMRTILRSTFIVRSIMVIIFPIATITDVVLGMFSVSIVQFFAGPFYDQSLNFDRKMGFGVALATTLVQGCLLSVLLFFLGLFISGIVFITRSLLNRA
jgi:hypothetical protein